MLQKLASWAQRLQSLRRSRELLYAGHVAKIGVSGQAAPIFAEITWIIMLQKLASWTQRLQSLRRSRELLYAGHGRQSSQKLAPWAQQLQSLRRSRGLEL